MSNLATVLPSFVSIINIFITFMIIIFKDELLKEKVTKEAISNFYLELYSRLLKIDNLIKIANKKSESLNQTFSIYNKYDDLYLAKYYEKILDEYWDFLSYLRKNNCNVATKKINKNLITMQNHIIGVQIVIDSKYDVKIIENMSEKFPIIDLSEILNEISIFMNKKC